MTDAIPDDSAEPTGLLEAVAVRQALGAIDDELLGSGDAERIREAIADALLHAEMRRAWREGLQGSGLDSPAGRRVLSAVRRAVAALDLATITQNIREARDSDAAERSLAQSLHLVDRDAAAELDASPPNLFEAYLVESSAATAVWLLPTDPSGAPRFWNSRTQRFEIEPRASRDWMVAHLGELFGGSAWRKRRAGTFNTIAEATSWACARPGQGRDGDLFVVDPDEDG